MSIDENNTAMSEYAQKVTNGVLYTYRRCPYAIRARMALVASGLAYEAQEISLRHKPAEMLSASPKGTVPVLILKDGTVIDESYEIMKWALEHNDPLGWLPKDCVQWKAADDLVEENDTTFKRHLDAYKYSSRQTEVSALDLRQRAMPYLRQLDANLVRNKYLLGNQCSIADVALFPFVRQFRNVNPQWFDSVGLDALNIWLNAFLKSDLFVEVMT